MNAPSSVESFVGWKQCYFWGISNKNPAELNLSHEQVGGLLNMVGAGSAIASLAAIDPKYLINHKGTTAWMLLFVSPLMQDKEGLSAVASGQSRLFLPADAVHAAFGGHINWPTDLIQKYAFDFEDHKAFVIPFIQPPQSAAPAQMARSLKSPDGALEIMGVDEFGEENPAALLALFHDFWRQYGNNYAAVEVKKKGLFQKFFGK